MHATPLDLRQHRSQVRLGGGDLAGELAGAFDQRIVVQRGDLIEEASSNASTRNGADGCRVGEVGGHGSDATHRV